MVDPQDTPAALIPGAPDVREPVRLSDAIAEWLAGVNIPEHEGEWRPGDAELAGSDIPEPPQ